MTIKEFAKNQGVSSQAVYQKIKAAGIELSSIKKENSSELSEDGLKILKSIFTKKDEDNSRKIEELKSKLTEQQSEIEKLIAEMGELKAERDSWKEQAEKIAEAAQKQTDNMQEALLRAQAINMASLQAAAKTPRLSWWQRITGKRIKAAEQEGKE